MGQLSPPVSSSGIFSALFSTMTSLLYFEPAPPVYPKPTFSTLKKDMRQIVSLAQRSQHQELMEFGHYVDSLISQLVPALANDELTRQPHIAKALEELQKTLHSISQRILRMSNSGGWVSYTRYLRFPQQNPVSQMRQQLNDALKEFRFGALVNLISEVPEPTIPKDVTKTSKCGLPWKGNPSCPPAHDRSSERECLVPHPMDAARHDCLLGSRPHAQPPMQGANPAAPAGNSCPHEGEITSAFMDVDRCRQSFQHSSSPTQTKKLAAALNRLSVLLGKAGRIREALEVSQESAGLYKAVADKEG